MSNNRNRIVFPAEFGRLQPQLAPAVQGGEPTYTLYLVYQDGTVYPLADDDVLEIVYQDTSDDEVYSTSSGLSVSDAEAGIVTWAAAAALGLAGSFWLQLKVNDEVSLRVKWKVEAALDASGTVPPVAMTSLTAAQVALVQAMSALTGLIKIAAGSATGIAVQSFMETFLGSANAAAARTAIGAAALGANTFTGAQNLADQLLTRPVIKDYGETVNAIGSVGGGTQDIDLTLGNVVSATVDTSTTTFTFSNPSASGTACSFTLFLTNGGSQTVNWPASVDWAGGTAPTLTSSGVDILTFATIDGGTIWYGFAAGLDMS